MGASAIREILKVVSQPGMISLAGGIPSPDSFPMEVICDLTTTVIEKYGSGAFQYDLTEGFVPLREALVGHLERKGVCASAQEILITSGSQGILDAVGKVLLSKGDKVAVEAPTYLGAIQAFNPYEPEYVSLETDQDGLIPESLDRALASTAVKFVYLVPTFQNPTGRTIPFERRQAIAEIIQRHNALLIEDDPYSDLRYRGEHIPPIKAFAPEHTAYASTLSKTFAPGLRIGFCVAPAVIRRWLVLTKQGVDLHTSTFNQALAAEYLTGGHLERQIPKIVSIYKPKQEAMLQALDEHLPDSFTWSRPEGGMFIWAEGPPGLDIDRVYEECIRRNVAFVPGKYFYTEEGQGAETMRLNYTMIDKATIQRAIRIAGEVIREETEKNS
jgi:2-aminoadipate transaminase